MASFYGDPRMLGHALIREGAAHNDDGTAVRWNSVSGTGRGLCECGEMSDVLTSGGTRKAWHRDHKGEVMQAARSTA
jgi:hypothetical protein